MTYIELIEDWQHYVTQHNVTAVDTHLYMRLLHESNMRFWENQIELSNQYLCQVLNITIKELRVSRDHLVKFGFIAYVNGDRRSQQPIYELLKVDEELKKQGHKKGTKRAQRKCRYRGSYRAVNIYWGTNRAQTGQYI